MNEKAKKEKPNKMQNEYSGDLHSWSVMFLTFRFQVFSTHFAM